MSAAFWLLGLLVAAPVADGASSSLHTLAEKTARMVLEARPEAPFALIVQAPTPALSRAYAAILSDKLSRGGLPPETLPGSEKPADTARQNGARSLLQLTLDPHGTEVLLQGELLHTAENFWSGRPPPTAPPSAVIALSAPIDEPIRILLAQEGTPNVAPPTAPTRLEHMPWAKVEGTLLRLWMGDADGDGRTEVLALTDRALWVLGPDGKVLASHEHIGARAPFSPKMGFGVLAVVGSPPHIVYRIAQRDRAEALSWDPRTHRLLPFVLTANEREAMWLGLGNNPIKVAFVPGQTAFEPTVQGPNGEAVSLSAPWMAATPVGKTSPGPLVFVLEGGALEKKGEPGSAPVGLRSGAGIASGDLDSDGHPELVISSPDPEPAPEVIRVVGWPQGTLSAQWEVAGPVRCMAAGDLDGDGVDDVLFGFSRPPDATSLERIRRVTP